MPKKRKAKPAAKPKAKAKKARKPKPPTSIEGKHGGAREGAGRPCKVLDDAQVDRLYEGLNLLTRKGRKVAADRLDREALTGRISAALHTTMVNGLKYRRLEAIDSEAKSKERLLKRFIKVRTEKPNTADAGEPPDDLQ